MEVYLIRHTTPAIEKGTCYGQTDLLVANSFQEEYSKLHKHLPERFDRVYTSPLVRCTKLAAVLGSENIITQDARLMELNFGTWENRKWNDISLEEMNPWMKDFVNVPAPEGENFKMLFDRTKSFYEDLLQSGHKTSAVVCHAGVIRAFLSLVLEIPLYNAFKIPVSYASVTKLRLDTGTCYCSLEYLNRE